MGKTKFGKIKGSQKSRIKVIAAPRLSTNDWTFNRVDYVISEEEAANKARRTEIRARAEQRNLKLYGRR